METGPRGPKNPEKQERFLSAQEAVEILFSSFYYSQGDVPLQEEIMGYIAKKHPDWKIPEVVHKEFEERARNKIMTFVDRGPHVKVDTKDRADYKKRAEQLIDALNTGKTVADDGKTVNADDVSARYILREMIARDCQFVLTTGRHNKDRPARGPYRSDISHFTAYVLGDERPPGPPVFSEIINDLKSEFDSWIHSPHIGDDKAVAEALEEARALVTVYNQNNLDKPQLKIE